MEIQVLSSRVRRRLGDCGEGGSHLQVSSFDKTSTAFHYFGRKTKTKQKTHKSLAKRASSKSQNTTHTVETSYGYYLILFRDIQGHKNGKEVEVTFISVFVGRLGRYFYTPSL